eukprot:NODE_1574_length_841_cov_285.266414_g1224_i0.p1 GENE.NODE_1574_length_841_cov_285.266414_g1224_i0~~NODE_1574_length_841_cov_285.266414_g1224_i0.p1  ORF type:complete len:126 (-),score=22.95 NODE_1574_length_841_cov_285.266414_g1224_i0:276-653(-)
MVMHGFRDWLAMYTYHRHRDRLYRMQHTMNTTQPRIHEEVAERHNKDTWAQRTRNYEKVQKDNSILVDRMCGTAPTSNYTRKSCKEHAGRHGVLRKAVARRVEPTPDSFTPPHLRPRKIAAFKPL